MNFVEKVRDTFLIKKNGWENHGNLGREWLYTVFDSIKRGEQKTFPKSDDDEIREIIKKVIQMDRFTENDWENLGGAMIFVFLVPILSLELQGLFSEIDETKCQFEDIKKRIGGLKNLITTRLHAVE